MRVLADIIDRVIRPKEPIVRVRFQESGKIWLIVMSVTTISVGLLVIFFSPQWLKNVLSFIGSHATGSFGYYEDPERAAVVSGISIIIAGIIFLNCSLFIIRQPATMLSILEDRVLVSYGYYYKKISFDNINRVCIGPYSLEIFYSKIRKGSALSRVSGHTGDLVGLDLEPIVRFLKSKGLEVVQCDR